MVGISQNSCQCHVPEKFGYISIFINFFLFAGQKILTLLKLQVLSLRMKMMKKRGPVLPLRMMTVICLSTQTDPHVNMNLQMKAVVMKINERAMKHAFMN